MKNIEYFIIERISRKIQSDQIREGHLRKDSFEDLGCQVCFLETERMGFSLDGLNELRGILGRLYRVYVISMMETVSEGNYGCQVDKTLDLFH